MTNPKKYTYRVIWSEDDGEHVGLCAEFPSLSWLAKSPGDALNGITKVVATILKDMAKTKELPPEPLSLRKFKGHTPCVCRLTSTASSRWRRPSKVYPSTGSSARSWRARRARHAQSAE